MLTVRFPTGVSITYNSAMYLVREAACWQLYTADPKQGGSWVASVQISSGAIVEAVPPCRMDNPAEGQSDQTTIKALAEHAHRLRQGDRDHLALLKQALQDFDARKRIWK